MSVITQNHILNIVPGMSAPIVVHVSQGDSGVELEFTLVNGDEIFDPTGTVISVHGIRQDGVGWGPVACARENGNIKFTLPDAATAVKGSGMAEVSISNSTETVGTTNFAILVETATFPQGVTYANDVSVYEAILAYVDQMGEQSVANVEADLAAEIANRQAADAVLQGEINTNAHNISTNANNIATANGEIASHSSQIQTLTNEISSQNEALAQEVTNRTNADNVLDARIDQIVAPSGEAPSAAEVTDARIGADGVTYSSLGTANRTQFGNLKDEIDDTLLYSLKEKGVIAGWTSGGLNPETGGTKSRQDAIRTALIMLSAGAVIDLFDPKYQFGVFYYSPSDASYIEYSGYVTKSLVIENDALCRIEIQDVGGYSIGTPSTVGALLSISNNYFDLINADMANVSDAVKFTDFSWGRGTLNPSTGATEGSNSYCRCGALTLKSGTILNLYDEHYVFGVFYYDGTDNAFSGFSGWKTRRFKLSADTYCRIVIRRLDGSAVVPDASAAAQIGSMLKAYVNLYDLLNAEVSNRASQDSILNTAITDEIARATSIESGLSDSISAENTRATTAEQGLQTSINNEVVRAQGIESGLSESVTQLRSDVDALNEGGLIISDEVVASSVTTWLNNHPEATTTIQDGAVTIAKLASATKEWINKGLAVVTDFGADPTGTNDSTNAIRSAIASITVGTVYFPKGNYKITDSIALKSNIRVLGEGMFISKLCPDLSVFNMGTGEEDLTTKAVFRTVSASNNICVENIGIDCSVFDDPEKVSVGFFWSEYKLDNFIAKDIYAFSTHFGFKFNRGDNYYFNNILHDSSEKTLPFRAENILSFNRHNNIIIDGINTKGAVEGIDFSSVANAIVTNVVASSDIVENDEAIDLGGCHDIIITNVKTTGYGEAIKLKQEGQEMKTYNVLISNCIFKDFVAYGINLHIPYDLNDYALENITIKNCSFSTTHEVRLIHQNMGSTNKNYGIKNLTIDGCSFRGLTYAIALDACYGLSIVNNIFRGQIAYDLIVVDSRNAISGTVVGKISINNNDVDISATRDNADIAYVSANEVEFCNNHVSVQGNGVGFYLAESDNARIINNYFKNCAVGFKYYSSSHSARSKSIRMPIMMNAFYDCTEACNISYMSSSTDYADKAYKGLLISNNEIKNSIEQASGIRLRASRTDFGFDFIRIKDNMMENVVTPIIYEGFVVGSNSDISNNMVYTN